jgi:hypothetical protein
MGIIFSQFKHKTKARKSEIRTPRQGYQGYQLALDTDNILHRANRTFKERHDKPLLLSKDGIEPNCKSVSLLCELQVDL